MNGLRTLLTLAAEKLIRANWEEYRRMNAPRVIFSFDFVSGQINAFGQYEKQILRALEKKFFQNKESLIALDVGANIGNHSIHFSRYFDQVHAFEPNPEVCEVLKINTRPFSNIVCHQIGLSDAKAQHDFIIDPGNLGASHIGQRGARERASEEEVISIEVARLDDMTELLKGKRVGFVKIDVEGHEEKAIAGMKNFLAAHRPIVALEQQAEQITDGASGAIRALREIGYEKLYIVENAPSKFLFEGIKPRILWLALQALALVLFGSRKSARIRETRKISARHHSLVILE